MSDFITLTCPSCGAKLQITNDVERFACGNCGNEHIIRRSGGIVSIAPIMEDLTRELTIKRLREDIPKLEAKKRDAEQKFQTAINTFDPNYMTAKSKLGDLAQRMIGGVLGGCFSLFILSVILLDMNEDDIGYVIFYALCAFLVFAAVVQAWVRRQSLKGQIDQMENERLIKIETMKREFQTEIGEINREISSKQIELQRYEKMISSR